MLEVQKKKRTMVLDEEAAASHMSLEPGVSLVRHAWKKEKHHLKAR